MKIKPKVSIGINLEDIAGSGPDHYNNVNIAIKQVRDFCFSVHKIVVYITLR